MRLEPIARETDTELIKEFVDRVASETAALAERYETMEGFDASQAAAAVATEVVRIALQLLEERGRV